MKVTAEGITPLFDLEAGLMITSSARFRPDLAEFRAESTIMPGDGPAANLSALPVE